MDTREINQIIWTIVISAVLIWIPIDATNSIGRGIAIGLFAIFCFFGLKSAVINDHFNESEGEKNKAVTIFYLVYAIIFYFIMQHAYQMTYLNTECFENDNPQACNELEFRINN